LEPIVASLGFAGGQGRSCEVERKGFGREG